MGDIDSRGRREPLKAEYEESPEAAPVTLAATGEPRDDVRACSADIGRAIDEAELREGTGRPGAEASSGDLLSGALAARAGLTSQAVEENFGVDEETRAALQEITERYWVVYQTRAHPPEVDTT